jgi:hypothetical protein
MLTWIAVGKRSLSDFMAYKSSHIVDLEYDLLHHSSLPFKLSKMSEMVHRLT